MNKQEKIRKNFTKKVIEEVYEENNGQCMKCGRSLLNGFIADHLNGDRSNNNKENCRLLCAMCNYGEQWSTLQKQKIEVIGKLRDLIQKAIDGQIAGALMEKTLDAIKLQLSLQKQVVDIQLMEAPATNRIEYSEAIAEYNLKEYIKGVKDGIMKALEIRFTVDTEHNQVIDVSCDNEKLKELKKNSRR